MGFTVSNITFDCADVMRVAQFWSSVLDRPLDESSSDVFASIGGADVRRQQPAWYFSKVEEPKVAKNRMHLDLMNADPSSIDDLVSLGATVTRQVDWGFHGWTVLEDPEGNEFCIAAKAFEERSEP